MQLPDPEDQIRSEALRYNTDCSISLIYNKIFMGPGDNYHLSNGSHVLPAVVLTTTQEEQWFGYVLGNWKLPKFY